MGFEMKHGGPLRKYDFPLVKKRRGEGGNP